MGALKWLEVNVPRIPVYYIPITTPLYTSYAREIRTDIPGSRDYIIIYGTDMYIRLLWILITYYYYYYEQMLSMQCARACITEIG